MMSDFHTLTEPAELELLVAFYDMAGFAKMARAMSDRQVFDLMAGLAEVAGDVVEAAGGTVVKFIGDAALIVFPGEAADAGVRALLALKRESEAWLRGRGVDTRVVMKVHYGTAVCGPVGTSTDKRFDLYGAAVNQAATTPSLGFALTAEAFRRLAPGTRKLFKKHTPPVRYIPSDEPHREPR